MRGEQRERDRTRFLGRRRESRAATLDRACAAIVQAADHQPHQGASGPPRGNLRVAVVLAILAFIFTWAAVGVVLSLLGFSGWLVPLVPAVIVAVVVLVSRLR